MEKQNLLENQLDMNEGKEQIPFLGGRPDRLTIISQDEITNLVINLNIAKSVDEFLQMV
jgi:hypothetical protein